MSFPKPVRSRCFLVPTFFLILIHSFYFPVPCYSAAAQPSKKNTAVPADKATAKRIKTHPEPSQAEFDARLSGKSVQTSVMDISDNPAFFSAQNKTPVSNVSKDLDRMIRPVLKRILKDAKLVEDIGEQPPQSDGEVEENRLVYVARQLFDASDGDRIYTELHDKQKWPASPRLGSKPVHTTKKVAMSFSKSSGLRGYSLVISLDLQGQRIAVISYRLGSKYDRLM